MISPKHQKIQNNKFCNCAGKVTKHPEKAIYNFSIHSLTEAEKPVLCKGL